MFVVGRHGFAVMLALSVLAHAGVAVCFSLDATEPPVALASHVGKASMSIRSSSAARPRVIGDGGATVQIVRRAAPDPAPPVHPAPVPKPAAEEVKPPKIAAPVPPAPVKQPEKVAPKPTPQSSVPPPSPSAKKAEAKLTPLKPAPSLWQNNIKQALSEWASLFPQPKALPQTPPRPKTEVARAETKPAADPPPPTPKPAPPAAVPPPMPPDPAPAEPTKTPAPTPETAPVSPLKPPDPKPAEPAHAPAKDQEATAPARPSGLTPGSPALPGTEKVKEVADEASAASGGSIGSEGVEADGLPVGLAVNQPPPYPSDALAAELQGRVILWVKIDATGLVSSVHVHESSGVDSLDRSALNTIRRWRFRPATRRGDPVPFEFLKPVSFSIAGR